jgi:hypothetical protein
MKMKVPNDGPSERKIKKGWIGIHVKNEVVHGRTRFRIKIATAPRQWHQKVVGTSYIITRFATVPESLLVYYMITDRSAKA